MPEENKKYNGTVGILIELQKQTHACVKELQRDVTRNTAKTVSNGVKLDSIAANFKPYKAKVDDLEIWKCKIHLHYFELRGNSL